jgi:putative SbcD/Mre11-related phosphoesterase
MKIKQFETVDRCLFWKEKKILVVGDLHLGWEEVLMERGWNFPKTQMEETLGLFEKIFKKTGKLKKIILLGDVKHYFAGILKSEFDDFYNLVNLFKKNLLKNGKVIITKGNHDNILEPILKNYDFIKLVDFFIEGDVLFFHGHMKQFNQVVLDKTYKKYKKINLVIIGHFHPAVVISEKGSVKSEKYKCFLFGKLRQLKKELVVVPSFFPLVEGTNILANQKKGFLQGVYDIRNFEVHVLSGGFGEVLGFGKVKKMC